MSRCLPTPSGFAYISMATSAMAPNHGAAAPHESVAGAWRRVCSRFDWFPWLLEHNLLVRKYHHMAVSLFLRRTRTQRRMSAGVTTSFHIVPPLPLILVPIFLSEFKPRQSKELRLINTLISRIPKFDSLVLMHLLVSTY